MHRCSELSGRRGSVAILVSILLLTLLAQDVMTQTPEQIMTLVSQAGLEEHIIMLERNPIEGKPTHTRSTYDRRAIEQAAAYIADRLRLYPGMRVTYDDFSGLRNVVGELAGTSPDPKVYVICAHYDSKASREADWNPYFSDAPGANDNATGVAAMLEAARVLSSRSHPHTIRFIAFDAEEIGRLGSRYYATRAARQRDNIAGVLNLDMLGFNWWFSRVEVVTNRPSAWLADHCWLTAEWYGLDLEVGKNLDPRRIDSDHGSFWETDYAAVMLTESGQPWLDGAHYVANPYYHTYLDTSDRVNMALVAKVTRLAVGVVAQLAGRQRAPSLPEITLSPPQQRLTNPVIIEGTFRTEVPLRIVVQPGDVRATLDRQQGTFSAPVHLKGGTNHISVAAFSPAGIRSTDMEVEFLPDFTVEKAVAFPNPGSELVQFECVGSRPMDSVQVFVHQLDGTPVRRLDGIADRADRRVWRTWWNLKRSGIPVVDGMYVCVFEMRIGERTYHEKLTLAVQR